MIKEKQRHGCLTAWLILLIVGGLASALTYLLAVQTMTEAFPEAPDWTFPAMVVISAIWVVCAIGLFKWRKWGFWGYVVSSIASVIVSLEMGMDIVTVVIGVVIGVGVLFGVLHIGGENKGWSQLE